ncbi:hypothetical protein HNR42_001914 [Deinobacterium chartae]|uniref:Roadblock/LAMTOR2 domain-containing protein n=1 Tax=Deinobacterium chartae TaxID=521158 RepID=A0A841I243_9DEIO|nr:roadblock/LC7 domain-containing protein [Deinobacterium chartae]MBB6098480.1 hypothetical protein [Deinobacterium chartae]
MSKLEQIQGSIDRLRNAIPELHGALVASTDGLAIAQSLAGTADPNRMAAMAATALGLGKRITSTLSAGDLTETTVSGTEGQIHIYATGNKGVLAVVAPQGVNVGLVHLEAREVARELADIL